ncbi:DUF805 domain-containing protein [Faecalibacter macacae]|uniref:DUF805 domain-containing protein n=1 Tax=Faecalibacter macacae TaxID=1859289 RepID=A0A3L9MFD3_9FLAO|nr:DUF805 domain-containing protein [Faecalibacter macacae]RLZ10746.1 DUF805 domain-containing protein [Faecalibacter macacae]
MFKNPFSFEGRIRRLEYGLSYIIYAIICIIPSILLEINESLVWIAIILYVPFVWFIIAQGAKRCHDRGNSGWYQLIPFYGLWMLFGDGEHGENEYGENPKGIGNTALNLEELGNN